MTFWRIQHDGDHARHTGRFGKPLCSIRSDEVHEHAQHLHYIGDEIDRDAG